MSGSINYGLYQIGWFACVLGAASGHAGLGLLIGALTEATHIVLARRRRDEITLAISALIIGAAVDMIQIALGTLRFQGSTITPPFPPLWLALLWMQFAATLRFSLRWLTPGRAVIFGALGGPLAFMGASGLGVVQLDPRVWPSVISLGILWSAAVPALTFLAARNATAPGAGEYRWVPLVVTARVRS